MIELEFNRYRFITVKDFEKARAIVDSKMFRPFIIAWTKKERAFEDYKRTLNLTRHHPKREQCARDYDYYCIRYFAIRDMTIDLLGWNLFIDCIRVYENNIGQKVE